MVEHLGGEGEAGEGEEDREPWLLHLEQKQSERRIRSWKHKRCQPESVLFFIYLGHSLREEPVEVGDGEIGGGRTHTARRLRGLFQERSEP